MCERCGGAGLRTGAHTTGNVCVNTTALRGT